MKTPEEKDVTTLVIARTLAIFVVVLVAGVLLLAAVGADARAPAMRVVAAVAALLSLVFVVRHRHD